MIFPEHELKVYYPLGGKHYLLRWYSHNEGHNIILARNRNSTLEAFSSTVLKRKDFDIEVKELLHINIVAPPEEVCKQHAEYLLADDVESFWRTYSSSISLFKKKTGSFPKNIKPCPYLLLADGDEAHYNCPKCFYGISPIKGSLKDIYIANRENWRKKYRFPSFKDGKNKSRAQPSNNNDPVWAAIAKLGHHLSGVVLVEIKPEETCHHNFLFFYQQIETFDVQEFKYILQKSKDDIESYKKKMRQRALEHQVRREKELFDEINSIFG